jgi:hypothetical protein
VPRASRPEDVGAQGAVDRESSRLAHSRVAVPSPMSQGVQDSPAPGGSPYFAADTSRVPEALLYAAAELDDRGERLSAVMQVSGPL